MHITFEGEIVNQNHDVLSATAPRQQGQTPYIFPRRKQPATPAPARRAIETPTPPEERARLRRMVYGSPTPTVVVSYNLFLARRSAS